MADANIRAVITAKDEASNTLRKFGDNASSVGDKVKSGLKDLAIVGAAAGAAVVAFGVSSVKAFEDSENRIAQTNAVLASTKGVAGVTADAVDKLSKSLQRQTTYSDEDVRSVENLLLTFTAINKDIFPQATKTVLNMATALGEDTKSASIQLGKALQDPVLGITALRRVGVNFNDAQKEVIKNLVDTGQSAKAQQLILKELDTEFGNSAEAARHTFGGSLKALKNQLNDVQETIGGTITKSLQPFIQKAADFVASIDWQQVVNRSIGDLKRLRDNLLPVAQHIEAIATRVENYLKPSWDKFIKAVRDDAIPIFKHLWEDTLKPLATLLGGALVEGIKLSLDVFTKLLGFLKDNKWVLDGIIVAFVTLKTVALLQGVASAVTSVFGVISTQASIAAGQAGIGGVTTSMEAMSTRLSAGATVNIFTAGAVAAFLVLQGMADVLFSKLKEAFGLMEDIRTKAATDIKEARDQVDALITDTGQLKQGVSKDKLNSTVKNAYEVWAGNQALAHRAGGGPVSAGSPYIVGEKGQELFVPKQDGKIIPNGSMGGSTQSSPNINITINAGVMTGTDSDMRKLTRLMVSSLKDIASSKGKTAVQLLGS